MEQAAGLWLAVAGSGLYHGLSPGMGWPLAVAAALFAGRRGALWPALAALSAGHLAAMLAVLLPFGALTWLAIWQREVRIVAASLVLALGAWLLVTRRHPRFLSRVPPHRLALWSFLVALAHGAALMLVPIYLGICAAAGIDAASAGLAAPLAVALLHSLAMLAGSGAAAYAVHRWFGIAALRAGWLNLEWLWAVSLILVGALALASTLRAAP